jgi:hypothetical protein
MHLDTAEDRNLYSNSKDDLTRQALDLQGSTNFFGDRIELYKNFINTRIS